MTVEKITALYKRRGRWHVFRCPEADPKLIVVDTNYHRALARAEQLFDIEIVRGKEAA